LLSRTTSGISLPIALTQYCSGFPLALTELSGLPLALTGHSDLPLALTGHSGLPLDLTEHSDLHLLSQVTAASHLL
jgi:hypothetical protein